MWLSETMRRRRELAMVATEAAMAKESDPVVHARLERRNARLADEMARGASYAADVGGGSALAAAPSGIIGEQVRERLDELLAGPKTREETVEEAVVRTRFHIEHLATLLWMGDLDEGRWTPNVEFSNCADMPWWCERLSTWMEGMAKARANWPEGPWQNEPDRLTFTTNAGLPGLIVRREDGVLCGYVSADSTRLGWVSGVRSVGTRNFTVANELFHPQCEGVVCHLPARHEQPMRPWLGFHCGGTGDLIPGAAKKGGLRLRRRRYRDFEYVRRDVETMAEQVAGVLPSPVAEGL